MAYEHRKKPEITLTDEQKELICHLFATLPPEELNLKNITQKAFNNTKLNGQTQEGRVVKGFIGSAGFEFQTTTHKPKDEIALTDSQRKKLDANLAAYIKKDIGSLELTKIIFENESLTSLHHEHRTIVNYLNAAIDKMDGDEFKKLTFNGSFGDDVAEDYKPPRGVVQTIARINKYVVGEDWKEVELKSMQKKQAQSLQNYLNTFRVKYEINSYPKMSQREVFEDAFIRYTYDKVNLLAEELDQYITLSAERVNEVNIKAQINLMVQAIEVQNQDSEGRKISMGLFEAIDSGRTELNQCLSRQDKLFKNLVIQRSKKEDTLKTENATMLNLVIPWQQVEFRRRTIHLAIKEKEKLKDEIEKLSSISEIKAMLRGLTKEEIDSSFKDDEI